MKMTKQTKNLVRTLFCLFVITAGVFMFAAISAQAQGQANFVNNLVGSNWNYNFKGTNFPFGFGETTVDDFPSWKGVTWRAISSNQVQFISNGSILTITFDSPDSFSGTDWDGRTAITGKRKSNGNFVNNLVGSKWNLLINGKYYPIVFDQATIPLWNGNTWKAISSNQIQLTDKTGNFSSTLTFDSPNSFSGAMWDGSSVASGKRDSNNIPTNVNINNTSNTGGADRNEAINSIVTTAGKPAPPKRPVNNVTKLAPTYSADGETRYVNEKYDDSKNIDSVLHLGLNDDLIFPGNLIRGDQVNDFVYIPISVARAPITISVSAEGSNRTGSGITETVANPNLSNMRQGIANLLKKAIGPNTRLPARVDFSKEEVYSEKQTNVAVGAAVSYGVGSLKTDFNWNSDKKMHRIVAKYTQIYFTVDVNTPRNPSDLFDSSASLDSLRRTMPQGSHPLYVSTVSYGMMALMFMESNHSADEMKTALDAAYKGGVDVKVNAKFTAKEILQSSKLKILVYGGSTAGLRDIETGLDGFMKVVRASNTYSPDSPGVPISYKFRNLQDNSLTFLALTSQYTLRKPIQIKQKIKVTVDNMICTMSDDEGSNNDADMDRFKLSIYASNFKNGKYDGQIFALPDGYTLYDWSTSGEVTTGVGYVWQVNRSTIVTYDTDPDKGFNFEKAALQIKGYGREYDSTGSNEDGNGHIVLYGSQMLGTHKFDITSADFIYSVTVRVELVN